MVESPSAVQDRWLATTCLGCFSQCGIRVRCVDGVVREIEGDPQSPNSWGKLCARGKARLMSLYNPRRVTRPLRRTNPVKGIGVDPGWQEISWEEAIDQVVERLKRVRREDPRRLLISTFDWGVIRQTEAWVTAFGTPNVKWHGGDYFCGAALHPVLFLTNGTFHSAVDLEYCNYCLLIGSQEGFMGGVNPNLMTQKMAAARRRGIKVVVVDPVCTNAAAKADEWVPIRPGTDAALALGMIHLLLNELGLYDEPFLKGQTNAPYLVDGKGLYLREATSRKPLVYDRRAGRARPYDEVEGKDCALEGSYLVEGVRGEPAFQRLKAHVGSYTPERVAEITTIPAPTIRKLAREFGEAACIGSTIPVEGKELPYRPVAVHFYRGALAHKHGMLTGLALQLLNLLVGAIYVPGAAQGASPVGPSWSWSLKEGPDGLIEAAQVHHSSVYPPKEARAPQTLELMELFPIANNAGGTVQLALSQPHLFQLPYTPEVLLHFRSNPLMSRVNPALTAQALRQIPFMVSFAFELNETAEFADLVFPDTHDLERLEMFPNLLTLGPGTDHWFWGIRQPVISPPDGIRHLMEVLLEIAERVGFLGEFYEILNLNLSLKGECRLDPAQRYGWEEIADRRARALLGQEYGLAWFKEHGVLARPKSVEERYPRPWIKGRFPIYFEFFQGVGQEVERVTSAMGLPWDTSDYQPLPDWKPCPAYALQHGDSSSPNGKAKEQDYDLFAVSYKVPFHSLSITADNPWLHDLTRHHPSAGKLLINAATARRKGISEGELIWVESEAGRVQGQVHLSECVHPEVIAIAGIFGHWARGRPVGQGEGPHFNRLLPLNLERIDMVSTAVDACIRVKVYRAKEN